MKRAATLQKDHAFVFVEYRKRVPFCYENLFFIIVAKWQSLNLLGYDNC